MSRIPPRPQNRPGAPAGREPERCHVRADKGLVIRPRYLARSFSPSAAPRTGRRPAGPARVDGLVDGQRDRRGSVAAPRTAGSSAAGPPPVPCAPARRCRRGPRRAIDVAEDEGSLVWRLGDGRDTLHCPRRTDCAARERRGHVRMHRDPVPGLRRSRRPPLGRPSPRSVWPSTRASLSCRSTPQGPSRSGSSILVMWAINWTSPPGNTVARSAPLLRSAGARSIAR
jgi:hypothetical protein